MSSMGYNYIGIYYMSGIYYVKDIGIYRDMSVEIN